VPGQFNAGHAYLQILPSFRGIEKLMQRETRKLAQAIDKSIAQGAGEGLLEALRGLDVDKLGKSTTKSARESGDRWASSFEKQLKDRLKGAAASMPSLEPKANLSKFDRAIVRAQRQIRELSEANVDFGDDKSVSKLLGNLDGITGRLRKMEDQARDTDQRMRLSGAAREIESLATAVRDTGNRGKQAGGAFAEEAKRAIERGLKDLPEINLETNASSAQRAVATLREQLAELHDKKIGIDIDRARFEEELGYIVAQLDSLARDPKAIELKYDVDAAAASLRKFADQVAPAMEAAGGDGGERFAGAFNDSVRTRLDQALRQIPNIPMTVDNTDAERKLAAIRVEMQDLADKHIGVDIDAGAAHAQLIALRERLDALDRDDVQVDVRTNALAAAAQLSLVSGAAKEADQSLQEFTRNTGITMSRLGYLIAIGASLGSVVAPAAVAAGVAVAGIGVAAAGAAIGLGVLVLGFAGIGDAVKKIDAYELDANKSAKSMSAAQNQVANALDSVQNAEENLSRAREDAGRAQAQAQERISDAQRTLARTQRDVADSVRKARDAQVEAIHAVAEARVDARDRVKDAVEAEHDAEKDLTRANLDQKEAREALNQALKDAVRDLAELDTAVKRNGNEIDKATTESMKAKLELDKIMSNPRSTELEKRMALEAYQDRLIQIEELKNKQKELQQQQEAAAKNGVESTDRVKKAREGLANADDRQADAQKKLDKARRAVAKAQEDGAKRVADAQKRAEEAARSYQRAQTDGAERIADAQRSVADAQQAAADTQRNSQRQIKDAQDALAKSQRSLAQAYKGLGTAGGEAFDNMKDALNQLGPAGQAFAKWVHDLKPQLKELRDVAQSGLLPGVQEGIQTLIDTYFPSFKAFIGDISKSLGDMFAATGKIFSDQRWQTFFGFLEQTALPNLQGMWVMALNLAHGIANIAMALDPLAKPMGQGLVDLSERFARWSDNLKNDDGFQSFMEYAQRVGPKVVNLIEQMVTFIGRLVTAAAPMGEAVLNAVTAVFEFINSWDIDTLASVIEAVALIGTGIYLLTGALRIIKFVTETWTAVTALATAAQNLLAGAVARYNAATVGATTATGLLNGRLFATQAAGVAGAAGMGAMQAAAGPLGIAIAGITAIWLLNQRQQQKADAATDELVGGFKELGEAYKKVAEGADVTGTAIEDTFKRVLASNSDMQQAVVTLTDMGASLDDIAAAAGGSAEEIDKMMNLIDKRIQQLEDQKRSHFFDIFDNQGRDDEQERLNKMKDRLKEAADQAHLASDAMKILNGETNNVVDSSARLTPVQRSLADAQRVLADDSASAEDQLAALTKVQDLMRQSAVDAIETQETWQASLDTLTESVKAAKKAKEEDATSLDVHTEKGRANRDMLENLITSANKMYDADVALNGVTEDAVNQGKAHVDQIRKVAKELGLNKAETEKLIAAYNGIPQDVKTAVNMDKNSFVKVYNDLQRLQWMQQSMKLGLSADEAEAAWKRRDYPKGSGGYATGGEVTGEGGPREDKVLARLSPGEFVQQYDAVRYYGSDFMDDLNNRRIPKDWLPGFARGGLIPRFADGGKVTWPYQVNVAKTQIPRPDQLEFGESGSGDLGGEAGSGIGWKWQMATLRKKFPGLDMYSGFRKNARTPSGNVSWHARGRAVDVPPRHDVFNFIHDTYGKKTQELIWLGDKFRNIQHGHHHVYSNSLLQNHGVAGMPNAHLHWAYDQGGFIPPGYSTVYNGTGKPEPVLTAPQWDAVINGGGTDSKPGRVYNIEFDENKLTMADLQAHERRMELLDRVGRPN
jgi:hypothetical protein